MLDDAAVGLAPPALGLYALSAKDTAGADVALSKYAGKVSLVVNTASL